MTISVSAAVVSGAVPTVLVSVSSSPTVTGSLAVWRVHEDGSRYHVLSDRQPVLSGSWSGYDYHAPFNQLFTYTVEAGGLSADSPQVYMPSDVLWLIHASDPDLSVIVDKVLGPQQPVSLPSRAEKIYVLGNPRPVVRTSAPRGESGRLVIQCRWENVAAVRGLLDEGGPVLMNGPWLGDIGWAWIYPSDVTLSNAGGFLDFPTRNFELTYEVCTEPDMDLAPVWRYSDARAEFAGSSYSALRASGLFDTYSAFRLNIRTP